jgi:hypothetical protein
MSSLAQHVFLDSGLCASRIESRKQNKPGHCSLGVHRGENDVDDRDINSVMRSDGSEGISKETEEGISEEWAFVMGLEE